MMLFLLYSMSICPLGNYIHFIMMLLLPFLSALDMKRKSLSLEVSCWLFSLYCNVELLSGDEEVTNLDVISGRSE